MKGLTIAGWLALTLIAMRPVGWSLAWFLRRLLRRDVRPAASVASAP